MEVIIAEFRAAVDALKVPESSGEPTTTKEEEKQEEKKSVHRLKVEALAKDLSKIISRMERKAQREKD